MTPPLCAIDLSLLGKHLQQERFRLRLNQRELSDLLDTGRSSVSQWEINNHTPSLEILQRCALIGMDTHFILTGNTYKQLAAYADTAFTYFADGLDYPQLQLLASIILNAEKHYGVTALPAACDIGLRFIDERQRLGLNKKQFAAAINILYATVASWERGQHLPNINNLAGFAKIGGDLGYLVTGYKEYPWLPMPTRRLLNAWHKLPDELQSALLRINQPLSET